MLEMNFVDYTIIGVILTSVIVGICRGFIKEIFSILTWVLAAYLAYSYGVVVGQAFSSIETVLIKQLIGSGIIFFAVLILGGVCGHLFAKVIKFSGLSVVDKFLGGGLGVVRAGLMILIMVPLLSSTAAQEIWWQQSSLVPRVQTAANQIVTYVPAKWLNALNEFTNSLTG